MEVISHSMVTRVFRYGTSAIFDKLNYPIEEVFENAQDTTHAVVNIEHNTDYLTINNMPDVTVSGITNTINKLYRPSFKNNGNNFTTLTQHPI